ncbi:hypothetical protein ACEUCL_06310 [Aeromonas dhakensis]|uniref:hypothetical protein n=1 Tax=Aeromonas dhakensis TaxID=196024 RepID=UPI0038D1F6C8
MKEEEIVKIAEKVSELGVSLNVDTYILAGVISIVAAAVGAFCGAYLKKKGENRAIDEGFTSLQDKLRTTTRISETIKDKITTDSHLYKYKFETYHLKQVEAIEGVYEKLLNLEKHAKDFITSANYTNSNPSFSKAKLATEEFIAYSQIKQIWIPQELFNEIETLAIEIDKHVYSVFFQVKTNQALGASLFMGSANTPDAMNLIYEQLPKTKDAIIQSIRNVLSPKNR